MRFLDCRFPLISCIRSRFVRATEVVVIVCLLAVASTRAAESDLLTAAELDQKLASIALLPDPLLSQVLMASTYPSDVAAAAKWAYANRQLDGDEAVEAVQDKPWDPSVQSLVGFPQVLAMLGENSQWVNDLGDAFLAQPDDVMDSVQFLRSKAKDAGNLKSNEQQNIAVQAAPPPRQTIVVNAPPQPTRIITITPATPQVVFVPIYNPSWAFGRWWHPGFPPFFFPPPLRWGWGWSWGTSFHAGIWWGPSIRWRNSLWGGVNWRTRDVNINVNRWNNINVNRRINSRDRNVSWRQDPRNRDRSAAARDRVRQRPGNDRVRNETPGRDERRDRARDALSNRVGPENIDRDALRNVDRNQVRDRVANVDRNQVRDRAANVDRDQIRDRAANVDRNQVRDRAANVDRNQVRDRAANVDRNQVRDRAANVDRNQVRDRAANVDRNQVRNRAANVDRNQVQNRAANVDRNQVRNRAANVNRSQTQNSAAMANRTRAQNQNRNNSAARSNRNNAMRGAGNAGQTRQQVDRGRASQAAQQRRNSGGRR